MLFEKIKNHSELFEYYLLKILGWCFFLFGFFNLFSPIASDKDTISLIEVLFGIKKWGAFENIVINNGNRQVFYFSFIISSFIPIIIGSILLLKNKPNR